MNALNHLGKQSESPGGKALWKIVTVIFGLVIATMMGMILQRINEGHEAVVHNYTQDNEIGLLQAQTAQVLHSSEQNQEAYHKMLLLITQLQDQQKAMQQTQARIMQRLGEQ